MKNIVKIIGFTAGVLIIIWVLSWFFDGAKWVNKGYIADRDARIAGMDAEVPGQIDVLNVGDSLCNVGMTPMELYRDYGYTAFNMGRDLQKPLESLFYIRQAVKRQPIKVILWEAHNLFKDESIITSGSMLVPLYLEELAGRTRDPQVFQGISGQRRERAIYRRSALLVFGQGDLSDPHQAEASV